MSAIFQRDPRANLLLGGGERVSGQDVGAFAASIYLFPLQWS